MRGDGMCVENAAHFSNSKASGLKIHIEKPLNHGTAVSERRKHETD